MRTVNFPFSRRIRTHHAFGHIYIDILRYPMNLSAYSPEDRFLHMTRLNYNNDDNKYKDNAKNWTTKKTKCTWF